MELIICSVLDTIAGAYQTPLFFQSKAQAVRSFQDAVNDGKSEFSKHPEDYVLMALGSFFPQDGTIVPSDGPERLVVGVNLVSDEVVE